jgi:hypothetical protein
MKSFKRAYCGFGALLRKGRNVERDFLLPRMLPSWDSQRV